MLTKHLHFSSMSQNEAVNMEPLKRLGIMPKEGNFIRKGNSNEFNRTDEQTNVKTRKFRQNG